MASFLIHSIKFILNVSLPFPTPFCSPSYVEELQGKATSYQNHVLIGQEEDVVLVSL